MKRIRRSSRGRTLSLILLNGSAVVAIAAIIAFMWSSGAIEQAPFTANAERTATPSSFPSPEPEEIGPVERLLIPVIDVDALVIEMGVDAQNRMEVPDRPDLVAWYDFTATPGDPGNAVFAAHVNWHTGEYAVFSELDQVTLGDEVLLQLEDGTFLRYRVTSLTAVDVVTTDAESVIGQTDTETITLITCHGAYDSTLAQFRERLVVRAERIL